MDCYRSKGRFRRLKMRAVFCLRSSISGVEDEDMEVDGEDDEALLMLFY